MGRKQAKAKTSKHKTKKQNSAQGPDEDCDGCSHLSGSIHRAAISRLVSRSAVMGRCSDCPTSNDADETASDDTGVASVAGTPTDEDNRTSEEKCGPGELSDSEVDADALLAAQLAEAVPLDTWICLSCGNEACGRYAEAHAKHHYEVIAQCGKTQFVHAVTLNTRTLDVWCYACDEAIPVPPATEAALTPLKRLCKQVCGAAEADEETPFQVEFTSDAAPPRHERNKTTSDFRDNGIDFQAATSRVRGLSNLGNTCYFNSVLQCLAQCAGLKELLERSVAAEQHTFGTDTVQLSEVSPLTAALLNALTSATSAGGGVFNPGQLLREVQDRIAQFKGRSQQDSHELLRHLLDNVKTDESRRLQAGILRHFGVDFSKKRELPDDMILKLKELGRLTRRTAVDELFGGRFINIIVCSTCKQASSTKEPFLDMSLPISSVTDSHFNFGVSNLNKKKKKNKKGGKEGNWADEGFDEQSNGEAAESATKQTFSSFADLMADDSDSSDNDTPEVDSAGSDVEEDISIAELAAMMHQKAGLSDNKVEQSLGTLKKSAPHIGGAGKKSVYSLLSAYCETELLSDLNKYSCESCAKQTQQNKFLSDAHRRVLILRPPAVLTLQLKRFQQTAFGGLKKIDDHIAFPFDLDITSVISKQAQDVSPSSGARYSLFGIVVHQGTLRSGHYIAYIKCRSPPTLESFYQWSSLKRTPQDVGDGEWYYASDSKVNPVKESEVLSCRAYILFYERVT